MRQEEAARRSRSKQEAAGASWRPSAVGSQCWPPAAEVVPPVAKDVWVTWDNYLFFGVLIL